MNIWSHTELYLSIHISKVTIMIANIVVRIYIQSLNGSDVVTKISDKIRIILLNGNNYYNVLIISQVSAIIRGN